MGDTDQPAEYRQRSSRPLLLRTSPGVAPPPWVGAFSRSVGFREGREEELRWGKGSLAMGRGVVDTLQRRSKPPTLPTAKQLVAGKQP